MRCSGVRWFLHSRHSACLHLRRKSHSAKLPPGALSTNEVSDVSAEICRDHLFDPGRISTRLPIGYRLIPAAEYAKEDPGVAELIKDKKDYHAYAVGSLCFVLVGSFVVDGVGVNSAARTPMAFWWVRAAGPRDSRMLGKVDWLQLASWYSKDIGLRERVLASDPMARFCRLGHDASRVRTLAHAHGVGR